MPSEALKRAAELISDRWTLTILASLQQGPMTFGALAEEVGQIAPNVLSARLRGLAESRMVEAEPYQLRPPRMMYQLSESGRQLAPALSALEIWASSLEGGSGAPWHEACGTPLEVRKWCPSCEHPADSETAGPPRYV